MKILSHWKTQLILIIIIAFVVRFFLLGVIPAGFDADEASFGYNAFSLLHTAKDEYGHTLPLVLKAFGDYKPALYAYLDIPFIFLFGLTPLAVRIVSALFGVATVVLLYFLCQEMFEKKNISLLAALLLALSPWHIMMSRTTSEVILAVFFLLAVLLILIKIQKGFTLRLFVMGGICGSLAVLSYTGARFFIIIMTVVFLVFTFFWKKKKEQKPTKGTIGLLILFILMCLGYNFIGTTARFSQIDIFHATQTQLLLDEQLREDAQIPPFVTRIFHNKLINYSQTIAENYAQYFTTDFLFLHGGYPERERIPNSGLFYLWELPFLFIGIYMVIKTKNEYGIISLTLWLLLILPAAITFDEIPNVYRTLIVAPFIVILIAVGISTSFSFLKNRHKIAACGLLFVIAGYSLLFFSHQYLVHQEDHRPWYRGYAYQPLVKDLKAYYAQYKQFVITKAHASPYIYILFFEQYNPLTYQAEGSPRDLDYSGFDKFYFAPKDCPFSENKEGDTTDAPQEHVLYVDSGDCKIPEQEGVHIVDTVKWQDNTNAFILVEYTGKPSAKAQ